MNNKFFNELKKLLEDKKTGNILTIALIIAFVMIAINIFFPDLFKEKETNAQSVMSENITVSSNDDYETSQKEELVAILSQISGVGEVKVMINFKNGETKVPAYDSTKQTTVTEEKDTEGGTRTNNQVSDGATVVMNSEGGDSKPFIIETYKPQIEGVIVVAQGAEDSKVKYDIQKAVATLYGLSSDKVNVYSMN